jgi:NAD+ synthase (glutamine-hydrolysing)
MSTTRVGGATLNQTPLDWEGNLRNIISAINQAKSDEIEILCLPELCITGYGCEDVFLGNWIYEKALSYLQQIVPHCENITVAIGLPVKYNSKNYNTTCVVTNAEIQGFYAKQNLANDGVHYEPRWFTPWQTGIITSIDIEGKKSNFGDLTFKYQDFVFGFEICEDAWRVDRPACRLFEKGVKLILNPSASHFAFGKTLERENLIVRSSRDFKCTYIYANLLGNEAGRMIYDGEILIAKNGHLLQRNDWLSFANYNIQYADVDILAEGVIGTPKTFFRDKNTEFVKASALALFDYLRKSKSNGFTLSLSGGADSSSVAILVSEMVKRGVTELGIDIFLTKIGQPSLLETLNTIDNQEESTKEIVRHILSCAYQGTINSSEETLNSAKALAQEIGATFYNWTIDDEVNSYTGKIETVLGRKLNWDTDDIALQNIQARSRSPIIWMIANIKNTLLLTTSNRSEGDVGYATMDGDTSGSIAPIAAVDKYFIINWLQWAEKELGYKSLIHVNNLSPTAELRPLDKHQTDEDDLMPYAIIVEIEKAAIRDHKSPMEVFKTLETFKLESSQQLKLHIAKFFKLWSRNQWKRERIAPAFHLDDFNVDPRTWCRFPILSSGFEEELKELEMLHE